jgi:hypothetical protein
MLLERLSGRGTKFLNVKYPIISGGMTWVSNVALVKAVSQHGIFPVLAGGNLPPDAFEKEVERKLNHDPIFSDDWRYFISAGLIRGSYTWAPFDGHY